MKILFAAYWSSAGWKLDGDRGVSAESFAYAKSKGLMFEPSDIHHDDVVAKVTQLVTTISIEHVSEAFLYSLSTRDLAYRSALGSYAMSRWMPKHSYRETPTGGGCSICSEYESSKNEDYNVLNFERLKWGGIRHRFASYQLFDLTEFLKLPRVHANDEDRKILRAIIGEVKAASPSTKPSELVKAIAMHIKSSKDERQRLIETLAYCGILKPKGWSGFFKEFTENRERKMPPVSKTDWSYPVWWWKGSDGVNDEALEYYFPALIA